MTDDTPDVPSASAAQYVPGGQAGPGRAIRMAREAAGLSLEELATQMRLARSTLDALERDDFSTLSEPVYIRGYYRKCAKALALSEAELLAAYERLAMPKAPPPPTKLLLANTEARGRGGRSGLRWLLVVLLAVLIGAIVFLSTRGNLSRTSSLRTQLESVPLSPSSAASSEQPAASETSPSNNTPATDENSSAAAGPAPAPPAPTSASAATAVDPGAEAAKPAEETPSASAAEPPAATTQATSEPATESAAPASTPAAAAAGDSRSLSFNFHGTSWVRVQDATGHTLLTGVISAGEHQTVQGTPPFSVFLGNAPAVDVEYAGAPLKIDSYVKANSTARFNVPLSAPSP